MPVEVRDAIYGLIELQNREWRVVDTRAFQRLRGIQQLAMTHLVYPGARHSRFEHCVGACHVAGRLSEGLELDANRLRLAALVHDIGHGPFSHVSEEVFERNTGRRQVHEQLSAAIVRHDPEVRAAIGDPDAEWVADYVEGTGAGATRSVERDVIAGPADADKLDYLLRDSHYCGVEYGRYDLAKVIESARVHRSTVGGRTSLAFHEEGIYPLEELLLARYHMHRQVYGHRTRVATDLMLISALQLGVEEGILPGEVFAPPDEPNADFVRAYLQWDDAAVVKVLARKEESRAGQIIQALLSRRLLKRVVRFTFSDLVEHFGRHEAGAIAEPDPRALAERLPEAEAMVAEAAGVEAHWVSIYWEHLQNPISTPRAFRVFDTDILIVSEDGSTATFAEASEVFGGTEFLGRQFVSIYLRPLDDKKLDEASLGRTKEAALRGLERIGEATAAL